MANILVIEDSGEKREAFLELFHNYPADLFIQTAGNRETALAILQETAIDLLFCATSFPEDESLIEIITRRYPFIPCIGIGQDDLFDLPPTGTSYIISPPFNKERMHEQMQQLLQEGEHGAVTDIPTHTYLQMMETEEKSCTLKIVSGDNTGYVYLVGGVPYNADTNSFSGEEAILQIISWEDPVIEMRHFNGQRDREILMPLIALIMESFRIKDDEESDSNSPGTAASQKSGDKQTAAAGPDLVLAPGTRLELEDSAQKSHGVKLIGYDPQHLLIVAPDQPAGSAPVDWAEEKQLLVRYFSREKRCSFTVKLLSSIDFPQRLLFLSYPKSVHYHELRQKKRIKIFIPCTIHLPEIETDYFGSLIDMGSHGCLCKIERNGDSSPLPVGLHQSLELRCLLPGTKEEHRIKGEMRNIRQDSKTTYLGVGFTHIHSFLTESIDRYLLQQEHSY